MPGANVQQPKTCTPETCHIGCALEVVDSLLRDTSSVSGEEVDALLDLRWLLRNRQQADQVLALFCTLRRGMEDRHYLAFYRLRRWLENQVQASVRTRRGHPEQVVPIKLDRYCVEAIRFSCLQAMPQFAKPFLAPKVQFVFRAEIPAFSNTPVCAHSLSDSEDLKSSAT